MRILMLLSKEIRTDARVAKEAAALRAAGHSVCLLQWDRFDPDAPRVEVIDGLSIRRIDSPYEEGLGAVLSMRGWWRAAVAAALRWHAESPFDVIHAHDLDTLPAGVEIKRKTGAKLVFDAHERYAQILRGAHRPLAAAAEVLERRSLQHVDRIITAGDAFADHYRRWDPDTTTVLNCFAHGPIEAPPPEGPFTVGYVGTFTADRFMPKAVRVLGEAGIRLRVGGKKEAAYAAVEREAKKWPSVTFLGQLPHDEVLDETARCHAVLCFQDPMTPQVRVQLQNKLFDAMALGRAVIAAEGTAVGAFVEEHGLGAVARYGADGLMQAVREVQGIDASGGQDLVRDRFNWPAQAAALVGTYRNLEAA